MEVKKIKFDNEGTIREIWFAGEGYLIIKNMEGKSMEED